MVKEFIKFRGKSYNNRHGGPFDRGAADSYYGRGLRPHYFKAATYSSDKIVPQQGSVEYTDYIAGYDWNEECGNEKDWG